jgi:hypothetical protein
MEGGMNGQRLSAFLRNHPVPTWQVLIVAGLIALASARPYAGSWNDGSRLATVEALVDYHTLIIDQSFQSSKKHRRFITPRVFRSFLRRALWTSSI